MRILQRRILLRLVQNWGDKCLTLYGIMVRLAVNEKHDSFSTFEVYRTHPIFDATLKDVLITVWDNVIKYRFCATNTGV